jgi:hypothetical protein
MISISSGTKRLGRNEMEREEREGRRDRERKNGMTYKLNVANAPKSIAANVKKSLYPNSVTSVGVILLRQKSMIEQTSI